MLPREGKSMRGQSDFGAAPPMFESFGVVVRHQDALKIFVHESGEAGGMGSASVISRT